ncbi:MAG: PHP domain-containing protein [Anaerolineae bacterium]|uniref:PHP domain-containing protein n=1 Tax=Candidatus Amarolinea dominans TaxID=3140696 RepID=UPI0031CCA797
MRAETSQLPSSTYPISDLGSLIFDWGSEGRWVRCDLHLHTVLSPCAEVEMIPPLIVRRALALGLDLIAVTDHNATHNVEAVQRAAAGTPLTVWPGMEVQTREEVHLLCLFDNNAAAFAWQARVDASLPPLMNDPEHFGGQFVVDATGEFIRHHTPLLLTSTAFSIEEATAQVNALGGLVIPCHVDRPSFSLLANLGFVPPDLAAPALEISARLTPAQARAQFPMLGAWPLVQNGDAHRLNEMIGRTRVRLTALTIPELAAALRCPARLAIDIG